METPNGSMISVFKKPPGWAGFFMRMLGARAIIISSVVVLEIEIDDLDFELVDPERETPVLGHEQAPDALPIAGELVRFPARHAPQFLFVLHVLKERNHLAELVDGVGLKPRGIVGLNESAQTLVLHIPDYHARSW